MLRLISILSIVILVPGSPTLSINDERKLDFLIKSNEVFSDKVQMYFALLDDEQIILSSNFDQNISFASHFKPLDLYSYRERQDEERYFSLLTKTAYGLPRHVSFFSKERLADPAYLQQVMPYNQLTRQGEDYYLKVGFGAPDITYNLAFFTDSQFKSAYPGLVKYFSQFDGINTEPGIVVVQHNHTFSKVLGQKTSKMSVSVTRYFNAGSDQTLAINYTLSYIYNLPPSLFGGGNFLINQMKKGIVALVRDTRMACMETNKGQIKN